jgi:ribosomal protein L10
LQRERHHATIGSEKWTSQRVVIVDYNGTVTGDLVKSIRANMHNKAVKTYFTKNKTVKMPFGTMLLIMTQS